MKRSDFFFHYSVPRGEEGAFDMRTVDGWTAESGYSFSSYHIRLRNGLIVALDFDHFSKFKKAFEAMEEALDA